MDLQATDISSDDSFQFGGEGVRTDTTSGTSSTSCASKSSRFVNDRSKEPFAQWAARLEIETQTIKEALNKEHRKPVEKKAKAEGDAKILSDKIDQLTEAVRQLEYKYDDTNMQQKMASFYGIMEIVLKQTMALDPRMMYQLAVDLSELKTRADTMNSRVAEMENTLVELKERYTMFLDAYDMLQIGGSGLKRVNHN